MMVFRQKKHFLIYLSFLSLLAFTMLACQNTGDSNTTIVGEFAGAEGQILYLENFVDNQPNRIDSSVIGANGDFKFETKIPELDFYRLYISDQNYTVVILDSTDQMVRLVGEEASLNKIANVEGSEDTQWLHEFYRNAGDFERKNDSLLQAVQRLHPQQDSIARKEILNAYRLNSENYYQYLKDFINERGHSPASLSVLQKLDILRDLDYYKKVENRLADRMGNSKYYTSLQNRIRQAEQQAAMQKQREAEAKQRDLLLAKGNAAPEINLNDPDGKEIRLSSLRGKVVLIDFWASWCKPCRIENPNVVRVYNKYKNKGFEIYGVSLDREKEKWVQAIQQDGLTWKHVSDLQFWNSEAARAYGVRSIPFTVLIDREGKIIATNLRGRSLENKLGEIFNQS